MWHLKIDVGLVHADAKNIPALSLASGILPIENSNINSGEGRGYGSVDNEYD